MEYVFQIGTIALVIVSWLVDREKTARGIKVALKRFGAILPAFIVVILLASVTIGFVSPESIQRFLGSSSSRWGASAIASLVGSVALMPGFVAFPLGGILKENGVPLMVISGFTTTLMMVGVVTFPVEKAFLGSRVAIIRNLIGFFIALFVALLTGVVFGEVVR